MRHASAKNRLLYEINTRVWLRELRGQHKRPRLTLAQLPDGALEEFEKLGFEWLWLMGVWQPSEASRRIAQEHGGLQADFRQILPGLTPEDILGSPYAVQDYQVSPALGGPAGLAKLRRRLARRGLGLILDFVPNHTARDHDWVSSRPEFYVAGSEDLLKQEPANYFAVWSHGGRRVLAHGRDPYFPGWTDTAQLDYRNPELRAAMIETLLGIAAQCDGVRCDMAMLVLRDVFRRTWGTGPVEASAAEGEFWAAAIDAVRGRHPDFLFLAEAYWGLESDLQALGFDYTYDKSLYDRLLHGDARAVREHLQADPEAQARSVRFLENHDEPRAASLLAPEKHKAAALVCYTPPGMRLFHDGQLEGRKVRIPVQLGRRPAEPRDAALAGFYRKLLAALRDPVLQSGHYKALEPREAWEGNPTWEQFVVARWDAGRGGSRLAVANLGPHQAQCYVPLDMTCLRGRRILLRDLLGDACYDRHGDELSSPGLYLDMAPSQIHLFAVTAQPAALLSDKPARAARKGGA